MGRWKVVTVTSSPLRIRILWGLLASGIASGMLSGCGIDLQEVNNDLAPFPTEGIYTFPEADAPGESLTQLLRVQTLMERAQNRKGKMGEELQSAACKQLESTITRTQIRPFAGRSQSEIGLAMLYCRHDTKKSLLHLRYTIEALQDRAYTPEPYPSPSS